MQWEHTHGGGGGWCERGWHRTERTPMTAADQKRAPAEQGAYAYVYGMHMCMAPAEGREHLQSRERAACATNETERLWQRA